MSKTENFHIFDTLEAVFVSGKPPAIVSFPYAEENAADLNMAQIVRKQIILPLRGIFVPLHPV